MDRSLFQKAYLLFQQDRYKEAAQILSVLLTENPNDTDVLALYAQVRLGQDKPEEARMLIDSAIGIAPDEDYLYYVKARVAIVQEKYDEAESNLQTAIQLNPIDADYYAAWASIKLMRKQPQKALELADKALSLDGENLLGLNVRSAALMKLDQKEASFQTIEGAFRQNPNSSFTHSNYGWNLLEQGDPKKALEHFREALRNEPNNEYARSGMAEAIKARYWFYRIFLRFSFWMSNLQEQQQWAFIIGFYFLQRFLRVLAKSSPELEPLVTPILIILAIFAFSTWVMAPLSNLFLRLNPYGKHLLNKSEIRSSNFVGISFIVFAVGMLTYLITWQDAFLALGFLGFTMMLPLSVMFAPQKGQYTLMIYAIALGAIGVAAVSTCFMGGDFWNGFTITYALGFFAFQWVANYFMIRSSNF